MTRTLRTIAFPALVLLALLAAIVASGPAFHHIDSFAAGPNGYGVRTQVDATTTLGRVGLVSSGSTTKTLVNGTSGCANLSIDWQNYTSGNPSNTVTHTSSWNAPGTCGGAAPGDITYAWIANDGHVHYNPDFTLSNGETQEDFYISTGTSTTKANLGGIAVTGGRACIIAAPWGGAQEWNECAY